MNTYYTQVNLLYTTPMCGIAWYRLRCVSVTNKELLLNTFHEQLRVSEAAARDGVGTHYVQGVPESIIIINSTKKICYVFYEIVTEQKVMF